MDMLNDHIRLVQFGHDGDVEKINLILRLAWLVAHQSYLSMKWGSNYCFNLCEWLTALIM